MTAAALAALAVGINATLDGSLKLWLAIKDLPAEGTPEEIAEWERVKARLAARAEQVRDLPILTVP